MNVRAKQSVRELPGVAPGEEGIPLIDGSAIKAWRRRLGLNQADFWRPLRVSQPQASRYESGWQMPEPVSLMLHLIYAPENEAIDRLRLLRSRGIDAAILPLQPEEDVPR